MPSRLNQSLTLPTFLKRPAATTRRTSRALVGLDIEPGSVVAAEARANGHVEVGRAAAVQLGPDVVRDGEVTDVEALTDALRELFAGTDLDKRVRIGIANQRIVVRRLELPPIADPKELATAVRFQAQDEIPMPLDSVVLDFHALGVVEGPNGPRQQVVLVAARRDMVERVLSAARAAGLKPEGVDLAAFAMIRALHAPQAETGNRVLYLSIGGLTNLAVADGSICHFTRVIGGGVDQIAADLAERSAVPLTEARALIRRVQLDAEPQAAGADEAESAGDDSVARTLLLEGIRRIASDVRNSLDFHTGQESGGSVSRAVLCGPASEIAGFEQALAAELGMAVTTGSIANRDGGGSVPASRLVVAAGLAIGERRA
jgi:type IV pilus assembly protein PilM